jgi:hypothetical protein
MAANIANIGLIPGNIGAIVGDIGATLSNIGLILDNIGANPGDIGFIIGTIGEQNAASHVTPGLQPAPIFSILAPINHLLALVQKGSLPTIKTTVRQSQPTEITIHS